MHVVDYRYIFISIDGIHVCSIKVNEIQQKTYVDHPEFHTLKQITYSSSVMIQREMKRRRWNFQVMPVKKRRTVNLHHVIL